VNLDPKGSAPSAPNEGTDDVASWRLAPTLITLRDEINRNWPLRDKTSDGSLGNASHAASKSDHNPDSRRVVCAIDIDEDLTGSKTKYPSFNSGTPAKAALVDVLLRLAKDGKLPQLYYVIYERKIYSRTNGFAAKAYNGPNAHDHHVHVSVYHGASLADRKAPWGITKAVAVTTPKPAPVSHSGTSTISLKALLAGIAKPSQSWPEVKAVQAALNAWAPSLKLAVDGYWGKASSNAYAKYQSVKYDAPVGHRDADGTPGKESLTALGFTVNP